MSETRMPKQKRSIEKRNNIIKTGFNLICDKGYYNITTNDIAEACGVSIGILYQYFNDKRDIFLEGIKDYSNSILYPMLDILNNATIDINNIDIVLSNLIDKFIKNHKLTKKSHEELMAMGHLDPEIANIFMTSEIELTKKIVEVLDNNNIKLINPYEKVHIIYSMIDNLCHDMVYHHHDILDYNIMKQEVIKIVVNTIKGN